MAYRFTKKQISEAVEKSNGTMISVSMHLRCRSSVTAKKYVEKYPDILEKFFEKQTLMIDEAENVLFQNLNSSNEQIQARTAEFILKNMPKSRWRQEESRDDIQSQLVRLLDKMMEDTSTTESE